MIEHMFFIILVIILALVLLYHSYRFRGLTNTLCIAIVSGGIGSLVEFLGVSSGGYHYGSLPITLVILLTGFGWIANVLLALHLSIVILGFNYQSELDTMRALMLSLVTGLVGVTYDLFTDPVATAIGLWSWRTSGVWFGVPIENFLGWFLILAISVLCYYTAISLSDEPLRRIIYSILLSILGSFTVFFSLDLILIIINSLYSI